MTNIILKSYKKVTVKKDLGKGKLPAGDYVVRHQDKWNIILWSGEDGQGESVIISTILFLVSRASYLIKIK